MAVKREKINGQKSPADFLLIVAVIVVAVSLVATGITYFSISSLLTKISGLATSTGETNLTVESSASVNFTDSLIDFGSGKVNSGQTAAYLDTTTGTVTNGNWTAESSGLVLENIGNVNVTLNLSGGKTAAQFIGGTSPSYKWNVSNVEAGSCTGGGEALNVFGSVNTTATARFCAVFGYADGADSIRIDFNLTVPSDSLTGALTDTITATADIT